jgi:predicted RNase H-like HicB family nuclease
VRQGKTIDEAILNIKDAINGYLYVQQKHGQNISNPELQIFLGEVVV